MNNSFPELSSYDHSAQRYITLKCLITLFRFKEISFRNTNNTHISHHGIDK